MIDCLILINVPFELVQLKLQYDPNFLLFGKLN